MTSRTYLAITIPTSSLQNLYSMIYIYYTGIAADPEPCSGFLWNLSTQSPQLQDPSGGSFIGGLRQYLKSRVWIFKVGYWFKYSCSWQFNIYNLKKGILLTCGILDRNRHKIEVDRRFQMFHILCNICTQYIAMDISLQKWSYFQ